MKLYYHSRSGHSHRVSLFLSILGIDVERIEVDLLRGAQHAPAFLALNGFAQVPVLVDEGVVVADSNAILVYLAKRFERLDWLPETPPEAARVQRWLSLAAGELFRGPCSARMATIWGEDIDIDRAMKVTNTFLRVLDSELSQRTWLAGSQPTIADLAHYAYVAHAPEGNVDISGYRHIGAWLRRIEALPGFVALPVSREALH